MSLPFNVVAAPATPSPEDVNICGLVANIGNPNIISLSEVETSAARVRHRGPDDEGSHQGPDHAVAHRRLSIIDVEGGRQPLFDESGALTLVCNGEIYNQSALKAELVGHTFQTRSDSEVIVHGCEAWGEQVVDRLDGMFGFVVAGQNRVLAGRDPLGIKPLYMGRDDNGGQWFASELKSIIDRCSTIEEFPAGHYYTESSGLVRYFEPSWLEGTPDGEPDLEEIRSALDKAVEKRLMSDVPVGVFLSGGLDSSLIAALMRRHVSELHSFTVGLEGSEDILAAREVARHLGTKHHEFVYTPRDVVEALDKVVYHLESYDPPLIRSSIPGYFVSRLAAEHVKVVLSGEGSDEAFAGYLYFADTSDPEVLQQESRRLLLGLHNMNLQRVDRMTMAHSLEARVPFLDTQFLEVAMAIAPRHKMHTAERPEKWLLRRACEDLLPHEILWRTKQEFAQGAGSEWTVREHCEQVVSDKELADAARRYPVDTPATKEELFYRRLFEQFYPGEPARSTVGRWHGAFVDLDRAG